MFKIINFSPVLQYATHPDLRSKSSDHPLEDGLSFGAVTLVLICCPSSLPISKQEYQWSE